MFIKIILFTVVVISQLHLLHAANKANDSLETMNVLGKALQVAAQEEAETEEGYSSDLEYTRHQEVNKRFFGRLSQKPEVRAAVQRFEAELKAKKPLTRISLDELSSRSRILLFRELTGAAQGEKKAIPFSFYGYDFTINLDPSLRQPGNGIVTKIGKHSEIYSVLKAHKTSQKEIAKKLLKARKKTKKGSYNTLIIDPVLSAKSETVDLDMLNILLDFEVARRLQAFSGHDMKQQNEAGEYLDYVGDQGKEGEPAGDAESIQTETLRYEMYENLEKNIKTSMTRNTKRAQSEGWKAWKITYMNSDRGILDDVPVASVIVGALKLSLQKKQGELSLQDFFHAPNKYFHAQKKHSHAQNKNPDEYSYGDYSAFEGAPSEDHRGKATKRIIRKFRGGTKAKHSTSEQLHQELLEVFGGDSESEGEPY